MYFFLVLKSSETYQHVSIGYDPSNPMYKATMSVKRFEDIRCFLRFDDKRTKQFRLQTDHMAALRHIWDLFILNSKKRYSIHECVTIEEQLVPFKGRCRFLQYIPTKPGKYGIKIFWLCRRRRRLKGIHSRPDTNRTGAEGLSFYYSRLLHCLDQMLAVMLLSQHRVSSSKTVRPRAPCGARCMGHIVSTWSAVCSEAPHSQFGVGARPHLCMDECMDECILVM